MVKAVNKYFFGETSPSAHDLIWYYGSFSAMVVIGVFALLAVSF